MKKERHDQRRSFLKHLLTGTAIAAGTMTIARQTEASEVKEQINKVETLYRETEEYKKYYKSLRS